MSLLLIHMNRVDEAIGQFQRHISYFTSQQFVSLIDSTLLFQHWAWVSVEYVVLHPAHHLIEIRYELFGDLLLKLNHPAYNKEKGWGHAGFYYHNAAEAAIKRRKIVYREIEVSTKVKTFL